MCARGQTFFCIKLSRSNCLQLPSNRYKITRVIILYIRDGLGSLIQEGRYFDIAT